MTKQRRKEISTHMELSKTVMGAVPDLEELYEYILELEDALELIKQDIHTGDE